MPLSCQIRHGRVNCLPPDRVGTCIVASLIHEVMAGGGGAGPCQSVSQSQGFANTSRHYIPQLYSIQARRQSREPRGPVDSLSVAGFLIKDFVI